MQVDLKKSLIFKCIEHLHLHLCLKVKAIKKCLRNDLRVQKWMFALVLSVQNIYGDKDG